MPQVRALVSSLGELPPEPWTDSFVEHIAKGTDGTPLLLLEILQLALDRSWLMLEEGRWRALDLPALFEELNSGGALRHRLSRLTEQQRELLMMLALAGSPLEPEH